MQPEEPSTLLPEPEASSPPDPAREEPPKKGAYLRYLPFSLFLGGFLFDLLTLSNDVTALNMTVIGLYAFGVAAALWLKSGVLALPTKLRRFVYLASHFCLGSFFSALVVLYFRSAGHIFTFLAVMILFVAMVWNEFAHRENSQTELLWAIFSASLVMYFNFLLPHLFSSVSALWFYGSTALALGIVYCLRYLSRQPWMTLRLAHIAAALIVAVYQLGWIPPVPLVMENSLVGVEFARSNGQYSAMVYQPGRLERLHPGPPPIDRHPTEPVYVLSAVSAPTGAEVALEHRWYHRSDDGWVRTDTIPINIRGGRKAGWRFYSFKRNLSPGHWKVETAVTGGAVLGFERFHLRHVDPDQEIPRSRQDL